MLMVSIKAEDFFFFVCTGPPHLKDQPSTIFQRSVCDVIDPALASQLKSFSHQCGMASCCLFYKYS